MVRKILKLIPGAVQRARDWAPWLTGFAGASRCSELVAFQVEDLELHICRSKMDQDGASRMVAIPRAGKPQTSESLQPWLTLVSITSAEEAQEPRAIGQTECEASERLENLENR